MHALSALCVLVGCGFEPVYRATQQTRTPPIRIIAQTQTTAGDAQNFDTQKLTTRLAQSLPTSPDAPTILRLRVAQEVKTLVYDSSGRPTRQSLTLRVSASLVFDDTSIAPYTFQQTRTRRYYLGADAITNQTARAQAQTDALDALAQAITQIITEANSTEQARTHATQSQ